MAYRKLKGQTEQSRTSLSEKQRNNKGTLGEIEYFNVQKLSPKEEGNSQKFKRIGSLVSVSVPSRNIKALWNL